MTDYTTVQKIKDYLGGAWGNDAPRDLIIATFVTACSRMFDRETGKPTDFWAAQSATERRYFGNGDAYLAIDQFAAITSVTMATNRSGTDAVTLSTTDKASADYVQVMPLQGPPYTGLYLARGFTIDDFGVGNVVVTGDTVLPDEIAHAVTIWVAYSWKSREVGWADAAQRPDGPGLLYVKGIPPETKRIIDYYRDNGRVPDMAVIRRRDNRRGSASFGFARGGR